MTIETVMDRLATILETIEGVNNAYAGRPDDVAPAELPAFVVLSGPANYDHDEMGMNDTLVMKRTYRLLLLVSSWLDDAELEAEKDCRPFFARVINRLTGCPGLDHPKGENPLNGVQDARLVSDTGVVNILLAGVGYAGIEWALEVTEYGRITYAD